MSLLNPLSWFTSYEKYYTEIPDAHGMEYSYYFNGLKNIYNSWIINNYELNVNGNVCGTYTIDGINQETGYLKVNLYVPSKIPLHDGYKLEYKNIQTGIYSSSSGIGTAAGVILESSIGVGVSLKDSSSTSTYTYKPYLNLVKYSDYPDQRNLKAGDFIPCINKSAILNYS